MGKYCSGIQSEAMFLFLFFLFKLWTLMQHPPKYSSHIYSSQNRQTTLTFSRKIYHIPLWIFHIVTHMWHKISIPKIGKWVLKCAEGKVSF